MRGFVASMADTCFYGNDQAKFAKSKISLDLSLSLTTENRTAFTSEIPNIVEKSYGFPFGEIRRKTPKHSRGIGCCSLSVRFKAWAEFNICHAGPNEICHKSAIIKELPFQLDGHSAFIAEACLS